MGTSFNIPEAAYQTGILEVSEAERYEAEEAVRSYHANRSVCLAKQKRQPFFRIGFLLPVAYTAVYYITEFWQADLNNYMAIISLCYTLLALFFVLFRKNLRIPGIVSLVYLAEMFRLDAFAKLLPTLVPIILLNAIAFFYEKDRRFLKESPGYPDFHDIQVKIKEDSLRTARNIPDYATPAEDPYKDVLSAVPENTHPY